MRDCPDFSTPGWRLECDFYIPSNGLIIEYDERQHFTLQRAKALSLYPADLKLGFDREKWRLACVQMKARDLDRCRDETRAFYDSLRDILAARYSTTLVRIKDQDFDWRKAEARDYLRKFLSGATRAGC